MAQEKPVRWMVALDTFSTDLESGASVSVTKGMTYPEGHEIVTKDGGRGVLFKPLDAGDTLPAKVPPAVLAAQAPPSKVRAAAKGT